MKEADYKELLRSQNRNKEFERNTQLARTLTFSILNGTAGRCAFMDTKRKYMRSCRLSINKVFLRNK